MPNIPQPSPDRASDAAGDVADLIYSVARRIRRDANRHLEPLGVTPAQVRALRTVARDAGAVRMSELADRLGIARRSATSVVDELVDRGLVARRTDDADRRAVAVELTDAGGALLATLADRRREAAGRLAGALPDRDLETLRTLLQRLDAR